MATSSDGAPARIVYLLTSDLSSVLVRGQLGHLRRRGFAISVGVGCSDEPTPARWDDGIDVHDIPYAREVSVGRDLRALWATIRLLRRVRPALVNASTPKAGVVGMLAARLCRIPVRVYVIRGLRFETADGWKRTVLRSADRIAARCATHVVANSASVLAAARNEGVVPNGVGVVIGSGSGNGVDVERFVPPSEAERSAASGALGIDRRATTVAFVGRLTKDKGVGDVVHAFTSRLAERGVRLLLVGDVEPGDPLDDATRRTVAEHAGIVHVAWLDDPRDAYRAADIVVFASFREGLPNVVLEAGASGVPVVAYSATGTVDAVVDDVTGTLVPVGDVVALGDALVELVDDPQRRIRLGRAARAHVVEHFDHRRVREEIADNYERWLREA